jgi:AraC-like DNA-binding protein
MIESGSLTPGVSVDDFGLPPGTALRIELPAPALRPFVDHYHVLDSDRGMWTDAVSWALPSWPIIRFSFDAPMVMRLGNRVYDPMPTAALYGFTSRAREVRTQGGVTVGAGLTPLGWARLFSVAADSLRDQVVPLAEVIAADRVAATEAALGASPLNGEVAAILDAFFAPLLATPARGEPAIATLMRLIADDSVHDIGTASARAAMHPTALRRLSTRYCGFPPKTLLVQERFMRSLRRMLLAGGPPDYSTIAPTYFDKSHFLRDAGRFLGMTPRRFLAHEHRYTRAVIRARRLVETADALAGAR